MRDHLLAVEKSTGIRPQELEDSVELPDRFAFVWEDFTRLSSSRTGGFGPNPIQFSEIEAYYRLIGVEPELWEIKTIQAFDAEFLKHCQKTSSKKDK